MEENDADIWTDEGTCITCRLTFPDENERSAHRNSKTHLKKWKLHNFFCKEAENGTVATSTILERYKAKKTAVIGLQMCQEIQQIGIPNQEKSNFWTCTTCYEIGTTYETLDSHLNSMEHIKNYMDECESEEHEFETKSERDDCAKYERYQVAAENIFQRDGGTGGLQPPIVLRLPVKSSELKSRFGIEDEVDVTFQQCVNDGNKSVLHCSTCNIVTPVYTIGKHTKEKARAKHYEQPSHQNCARLLAIIDEFNPQEIFDEYKTAESHMEVHWVEKRPNEWYLSQPCGYRYSIKAGNETMCTICYAFVEADHLLDHFSSEYHVMRYLNMIHSYNAYLAQQLSGRSRREKALKMLLSTLTLESDTKKVARSLSRFPTTIKNSLNADLHTYHDVSTVTIDDLKEKTGKIFRQCLSCSTWIEFSAEANQKNIEAAWQQHIFGDDHFKTAAMRARTSFDSTYFVPYLPTIINQESEARGLWKMNKDVLIQTQCDVGLEGMIEDEIENEVTCQSCWQVFSKNPTIVNQHIRSFDHMKQYFYTFAPTNMRLLLGCTTDVMKQEVLLRWLQENSGHMAKRMHLYSKPKALELSSWSDIPLRTVESALLPDKTIHETVWELVDKVSNDGEENKLISAREALLLAGMVIINTARGSNKELSSIVCKCDKCNQLVLVKSETWQSDVFEMHVCSAEHHRRANVLQHCKIHAFGLLKEKSSYTVKPFIQKDASKKVLWQWNPNSKQHEYVANVVGLDDIIERRYMVHDYDMDKKQMEFFCQICARVFPKRAAALESHVREFDHCINWVNQHRPGLMRELHANIVNQELDKGKELRKYLHAILKDVHSTEDYCIRVFDPEEEGAKQQMLIKQQNYASDKAKRLVEAKERLAADTAKFKQKQEERYRELEQRNRAKMEEDGRRREIEKQKHAEREARLQYAKATAAKIKARESPGDLALKSKLEYATLLEKQNCRERLDVQKARLEAERIQLLSKAPPKHLIPTRDPQLVIMPQVKSQPVTTHPPYGVPPVGGPPGINIKKPAALDPHSQPPPSFFGVPPPSFQPNQPPPFTMTFSNQPLQQKELPAYSKRPSLRGKKVDTAIHNATKIKNKADLLNYMRSRGATKIVDPAEIPREFSQNVQDCPEAFGIKFVAEVICLDDPTLDSYLCTVCDSWNDPRGMLRHLCTIEHKSKYMFHEYPHYHAEVTKETNKDVRRSIFKNFTNDLKGKHVGDVMDTRMETIIDRATIERLWEGFEAYFYKNENADSWSSGGFKPIAGPSVVLPKKVPVVTLLDDDDMDIDPDDGRNSRKRTSGRERSRSRDRSRRSRSREHRRRRSRSYSRSRSRDRYYQEKRDRRSRSRSRSRSRNRSRSRSRDRKRNVSWTEQTDSFLAKLGDNKNAPTVPSKSGLSDFNSKLATVRDLTQSGIIQGSQIDGLDTISSTPAVPAPVATTQSAEDRRRITREKEEHDTNVRRKMMGAMVMMEDMLKEYNGNVPRQAVLKMYQGLGLDPVEGDREINMILADFRKQQAVPQSKSSISESIMSLGIQLNSSQNPHFSQAPHYPQQNPPVSQQNYGISSGAATGSSAYSQTFNPYPSTRPLSPISASITPLGHTTIQQPVQTQHQQQSFYQNPPTSMSFSAHQSSESIGNSSNQKPTVTTIDDSSDDDDEYSEVYKLIGKDVEADKKKKMEEEKKKSEEPMIPGQKMALKRTILPSGARVGEQQSTPIAASSPAPSDASSTNRGMVTSNTAASSSTPTKQTPHLACPPLESSLGMPAPIAVTKPGQYPPQQQPQLMMYQQQGYQMTSAVPQYQQHQMQQPAQSQQQMYQQPQVLQQQQYGIQQPVYQQQPPQQYAYAQQPVYQPPMPQYPPQPQMQQQYYQNPPQQAPQQASQPYGIGGTAQQYYWPPR